MRTLTFNHVIGAGSMGTVYHAELRVPGGFRRPCAVKVIKAQGPDREHFVSRMRDEARLLGMLQDEQILGVTDLVLVEGHDAVVMEYVEGVDLHEVQSNERVAPRALAELGAEIAGTLHRAHTANHPTTGEPLNVIHRDVKPANIMVTVRGGVRLLDFGVARAAFASRESHTQGLVLGTLNYFPPEILAGEEPTPAVDIYGLGISLWECATGKEWGPPRVQQKRFERRVDSKLAELGGEFAPLLPVLRQVLQWDPELRPDGGVVERSLLHAADSSTGRGLRTWAREVVPELLKGRGTKEDAEKLVGRTIEVRSYERGSTPGTAPPRREPSGPVALDQGPHVDLPRNPPDPASTWNTEAEATDVMDPGPAPAPPAPRGQRRESSASKAPGRAGERGGSKPKKGAKNRKKATKRRGMSPIVGVVVGILLGLVILVGIVAVLVVIVIIGLLLVQ